MMLARLAGGILNVARTSAVTGPAVMLAKHVSTAPCAARLVRSAAIRAAARRGKPVLQANVARWLISVVRSVWLLRAMPPNV